MKIPHLACDLCQCMIRTDFVYGAPGMLVTDGKGFEKVINRDNRWELVPAEQPDEARIHICNACLDGLAVYFESQAKQGAGK